MTMSISKMTIDYYLNSAAVGDGASKDMTAYYTETKAPAGRWVGSGLAGVSLSAGDEVSEHEARAIFQDHVDPATGEHLGRPIMATQNTPAEARTPRGQTPKSQREGVAGFDLTFSVPKSVSTLWALAGPELQGRIQSAHEQALTETLDWVESNVAQTRAGHGGIAHVPVTGLVASLFDHWDSREGDPQLHTHAVVSNKVQRASDGQWVTLDSYTLHRHVVAISETYNSLLFDRLHQQVGALPESREAAHDPALEEILNSAATEHLEDQSQTGPAARVELAGVPDSLIEEFSTRSQLIEARTDELVAQWAEAHNGARPPNAVLLQLRQQATLETRAPKEVAEATLPEKMVSWRRRALNGGHSPARIIEDAVGHPDQAITPAMITEEVTGKLAAWTLQDASQRRATFSRANVVASAERVLRLVRCASVEERQQLVTGVVDTALGDAVELTPTRSAAPGVEDATTSLRGSSVFDHQRHAGLWSTQQTMDEESYLISRAESDHAPTIADHQQLTEQLSQWRSESGHTLSADQHRASHHVLTSTAGVDAIIGPAGTGKTTTMSAITDAWQTHHGDHSVVGLAPSAVAAGVLGDEIGVPTDNVAKWLYETIGDGAARRANRVSRGEQQLAALSSTTKPSRAQQRTIAELHTRLAEDCAIQAKYQFHPGQLLILDEASMVSTAQLAELSHQAQTAGAKVVLVGDPAQLEAVDAGGFLGHMERNLDHAQLNQVWRFKNRWEAEASLRLRRGEAEVLTQYEEQGRLHGDADTDPMDTAYSAWRADQAAGRSSILIASDNTAVAELDQRAHVDRVAAGEVDVENTVELKDQVTAGAGEIVLARRNDRNIRDSTGDFVANGTRMTVETIHPDGSVEATVESTGGSITLDADYLKTSVELGYAVTAHRSQGVTVDTAHSVVSSELNRELFYVAMTRGKHGNHAYVEIDEEEAHSPDTWEMLTQAPEGERPAEVLTTVVNRSTAERSAHEVQAAEHGWSKDLGRLCHEATYLQWASREQRTHDWAADHYPPEVFERLYSDQDWPRLAAADPALTHTGEPSGDDTVAEVLSRCSPPEHTAAGPGGMLPAVQSSTDGQHDLLDAVYRNADSEVAVRVHQLRQESPEWFTELEAQHADPQTRREVLDAVVTWRAVSNQTEAETAVGKEPPRRDNLRPYWERLQATLTAAQGTVDDRDPLPSPEDIAVDFDTMDHEQHRFHDDAPHVEAFVAAATTAPADSRVQEAEAELAPAVVRDHDRDFEGPSLT